MPARAIRTVLALALLAGCAEIPRDTEGTLERATGGTLRVGLSPNDPWTSVDDGERTGVEVRLVEDLAASIDAEVEWLDGGEEVLVAELHSGGLDMVVGGLTARSPWSAQAALTRPYVVVTGDDGRPEPHVMAVRVGENALLVAVERHLQAHEAEVAQRVGGEVP